MENNQEYLKDKIEDLQKELEHFQQEKERIIPIVFNTCANVISTEGLQSSPKWRNLLKKQISRLRFAALEMTRKSALFIHNWYQNYCGQDWRHTKVSDKTRQYYIYHRNCGLSNNLNN
jgi:hypothetical protein